MSGNRSSTADLQTAFSNPTIKNALHLLGLADLVRKIPAAEPSGLPLRASASDKIFKTILVDIGLMRCLNQMPVDREYMRPNLLHIFQGAMAEQFVGQELIAAGARELYYWSRRAKSSTAEVDYLVVIQGKVYPLEVKSGVSGRLKSLHLCLQTYANCPKGLVLSDRPYQELPAQNLVFIPLYYAGSLKTGNL
jgi:hypothetical protein